MKNVSVKPLAVAFAAVALALMWQVAVVYLNYGGNWTALFCTGGTFRPPPRPEYAGTKIFGPESAYDGQFYRYIAHDPLLRHGTEKYIDAPAHRWRRILVPALAYLAALGRQRWIDTAYIAVTLAFVFLGAWWVARFATQVKRSAVWGLTFLTAPGVLVSIDRLTVDAALAALCCAWIIYVRRERFGVAATLVACALPFAKEPGVFFNFAGAVGAWREENGAHWKTAAWWALCAAPGVAWAAYATTSVPSQPVNWFTAVPYRAVVDRILNGHPYPPYVPLPWAAAILDYVALAGMILATLLAIWLWWKRRWGAEEIALLLLAILAIFAGRPDTWAAAYGYGRIFTPLLVLLALRALETRRAVYAVPLAAVALRVGAQFGYEAIGVAAGLLPPSVR